MFEEEIEIETGDGTCGAVVFAPEDEGEFPGVLFYTDIFGIREVKYEMARRLAGEGYVVLMPNVFYRTRKPPVFDFEPNFGEERTMRRFQELTEPLTPDAMETDASAYVDALAARDAVADGPMGVVGHCFTGQLALRTAAARPDRIGAAASFHGAGLWKESDDSPHLVLPDVEGRLYFGHAANDRSMPAEAIEHLEAALDAWGGEWESEVYDAGHGWTVPDKDVYDQEQADRAFDKLTTLFDETL